MVLFELNTNVWDAWSLQGNLAAIQLSKKIHNFLWILRVIRSDTSQLILNKHLFIESMLPYYTKRYALPFLNWEISLTFAQIELKYLVIFMIKRHQAHFSSASLNIYFDPLICVDLENLAETFIGKLLSGETNFEQIENWQTSSFLYHHNV